MPTVAVWIIAVSFALAAVASLWIAGEMPCRNCLAKDETPEKQGVDYCAVFGGGVSSPGASCSRLPLVS